MQPISLRGPSFFCVVIITACMKLSSEIFAVWHSPYPVNKFELSRPSEHKENGWEHFFLWWTRTWIWKKTMKILGPKLGSHLLRTLGIHGSYQYVAQLSFSRAVVFFCSLQSRLAVMQHPVFSKCWNWPKTTRVIPKYYCTVWYTCIYSIIIRTCICTCMCVNEQ